MTIEQIIERISKQNAGQTDAKKRNRTKKPNTELSIDLKTLLAFDRFARLGKTYTGCLTRDGEYHFTFEETADEPGRKEHRNPKVYNGQFITMTRKPDGTYRLNFKQWAITRDTQALDLSMAVGSEILQAVYGLRGVK